MTLTLVAAVFVLGIGIAAASPDPPLQTYMGKTAEGWHFRYVKAHRAHSRLGVRLRQTMAVKSKVFKRDASYAITLASSVFRVPSSQMWAVARCETGGTFSPYARNASSSASGIFQFLDSTWAAQGIQGFSVYDPVANALGAARIVAREGWGQWACRP